MSLWEWLVSPAGLTPHGFCLTWSPGLLWLHAGSDAVTALAYFSIPLALLAFVRRRPDIDYPWVAYLFVAFIAACGLSHVLEIYTIWVPAYGVEGLVKLATALLSIATAATLWPLLPRLVALPSPAQLREVNARLSATVVEQAETAALLRASEARARAAAEDLERRVAERTADLSAANQRLIQALEERTVAETALRESESRMRLALEGARFGVFEFDLAAQLGRLDARAAEMTGGLLPADVWLPLQSEVFASWSERVHPDDQALRHAINYAIRAGVHETVNMEYRVQRADGEWRWLTHWRAVVDRDPDTGAPLKALGIVLDTTERARAEADLRTALGQRDLLLREVYHRVKNNLQIVDGLIFMQARTIADPEARQALEGLRSRIYALGLVHAQLMTSKDLETFDFAPFLTELAQNIVAGGPRPDIALHVEACPFAVDLDFAVPMGLLVTELITNSLKHAFAAESGEIRVELARGEAGGVMLTVADSGGAPPEAPSTGRRRKPSASVGTSIIDGLVRQLSATQTVKHDGGRRTTIHIPEPHLA